MRNPVVVACASLVLSGLVFAQTPPSTNRTLTITNQCPAQTLNVGGIGGYVQDCGPAPGYSCPTGTACNTSRSPNPGCFWTLPSPTSGSSVLASKQSVVYTLTAPAITETVQIPGGATTTIQVKWSGSIFAATGCNAGGTNCQTGMCNVNGKPVVCSTPGVAPFPGPLTTAEFTLAPAGPDYYDVTLINGMNVPVSMAPASVTSQSGSNAYFCQTPGSLTASSTGLSPCNWNVQPSAKQAPYMALESVRNALPDDRQLPVGPDVRPGTDIRHDHSRADVRHTDRLVDARRDLRVHGKQLRCPDRLLDQHRAL